MARVTMAPFAAITQIRERRRQRLCYRGRDQAGMGLTEIDVHGNGAGLNGKSPVEMAGRLRRCCPKTFVNDGRPIVGIAGMQSKILGSGLCMSGRLGQGAALPTARK